MTVITIDTQGRTRTERRNMLRDIDSIIRTNSGTVFTITRLDHSDNRIIVDFYGYGRDIYNRMCEFRIRHHLDRITVKHDNRPIFELNPAIDFS